MKMIGGKRFTVPHSVWGNLSSRDSRSAAAFDAVNNVYAASQQQDYEDKERERNLGIAQRDAQFNEDRRRFDEQINLLRGRFGGMGGDGGYTQIPALASGTGSAYQKGPGMTSGGTPESGGQDKHWTNRLRKLMTDPSAFQRTPGFKAALDTGTQAIQRSFAARGMGNSGNVLAELMKYGTGLASQEYGSQVNRLSRLAQDEQGNPDYWKGTPWGAA